MFRQMDCRRMLGKDATIMKPDDPKIRILIVEDVPNVAAVLKARLESFGYDVCAVAQTGSLAIASAFENRPDLILMDILLEGDMNGIEAAEHIGAKLDVPIIFLSCLNDPELLHRALKIRPYGFILKPYDHAELHFNIENALARHKSAALK